MAVACVEFGFRSLGSFGWGWLAIFGGGMAVLWPGGISGRWNFWEFFVDLTISDFFFMFSS